VTDAEHELLVQTAEQEAELTRLRDAALRAARAAIAAQDRADGAHDNWLDDLVDELGDAVRG
jgi:hypothetical protein